MITIDDLFHIKTGKIPAYEYLEEGDIPCVYNYSFNNGIIGFVKVDNPLHIFKAPAITVGYFGDANVQFLDFTTSVIDKSKVKVLIPKREISIEQMLYVASYINKVKNKLWNYARYCGVRRLKQLEVPDIPNNFTIRYTIDDLLPEKPKIREKRPPFGYKNFEVQELYKPMKGKGDYLIHLEEGTTPIVSATNDNNGITTYVDLEPIFKAPLITVERVTGSAFVQLSDFVTVPDDVVVLKPIRDDIGLEFMLHTTLLIRMNRWKYCYGRKLTSKRIKKIRLPIPINGKKEIDLEYIENFVKSFYGWNIIEKQII